MLKLPYSAHFACGGGLFSDKVSYCQAVPGGGGVLLTCYDEF